MSFFKGTSINQDGRFINKDKKLIEKIEFPPEYATQINKNKLNLEIIKSWVDKKLTDILGFEDECLCSYIINLIDEYEEYIEPKKIHYAITGFLDNKTYIFMQDFWKLLISAQKTPDGIPRELIEEKKEEIIQQTQKQKQKLKFLDDLLNKNENSKTSKEENQIINLPLKSKSNSKESKKSSSHYKDKSRHSREHKRHHRHHHYSKHRNRERSRNRSYSKESRGSNRS